MNGLRNFLTRDLSMELSQVAPEDEGVLSIEEVTNSQQALGAQDDQIMSGMMNATALNPDENDGDEDEVLDAVFP